jgi:uncharacterized RDD family membrane protein YckC
LDARPPEGSEPEPTPPEPAEPPPAPVQPAPMPWERPASAPDQPRSTIISSEPVLSDQPGAPGPEVSWAPPPPPVQRREVPGAPGFVFASTSRRFVAYVLDYILLLIAVSILDGIAVAVLDIDTQLDQATVTAAFSIFLVTLSFLYFVLFWTSPRPSTLGMRALKIQIGTAFEGRPLPFGHAIVRWALLGFPLILGNAISSIAGAASTIVFVWYIVLLVSTIASNTKQGIHDQIAHSAVVEPAGLGRSVLVTACLVIVIAWLLFWLAVVVLIVLGGQISSIESQTR